MSAEQDPGTVAIGDTFKRVGENSGPWEVTERGADGGGMAGYWWIIRCGNEVARELSMDLLDPTNWRRVRAPEWGYVYEVRK